MSTSQEIPAPSAALEEETDAPDRAVTADYPNHVWHELRNVAWHLLLETKNNV
jgi:hypothetical protein